MAEEHSGPILAADGRPLKQSLNRALFAQRVRALLLIAPLLLFVMLSFIIPIADMLYRSVENNIVRDTIPQTVRALGDWDGEAGSIPDEAAFAGLANDLKVAIAAKKHTRLGSRLNYEHTGIASLFRKSGRQIKKWNLEEISDFKAAFAALDKKWVAPETWQTFKRYSPSRTAGYYLNAVDRESTGEGIVLKPESERIYIKLFIRTIVMSLLITCSCLLLGYPVAWLLANLPTRKANLLLILVLLPFWTSLLVRTSAWKVLLQQQGVINDLLVWVGIIADNERLIMINNQFGTIVAMTHILLPFMILPLFSVMKSVNPSYLRAAKSLGGTDWTSFWRVYFPQTVPGVGAGAILVFILSIGYYITPEIVGGTSGVFISNRIAYHISSSLNWGLAAALGALLLVLVLALYWVYDRIVGIDNMKLG